MIILPVVVPQPGTAAARVIDAGSGIVMRPGALDYLPSDTVEVYFEGNRYGAVNLRRFTDRVHTAAGRLSSHYPTVARGWFPRTDFVPVGTYTFAEDWSFYALDLDPASELVVRAWVGHEATV